MSDPHRPLLPTATADPEVLVRMRGVHFGFGARKILDGVDLDIPRGKVTAIMGPSGCGKTTLLRLIGGQHRPGAGTVEVDGIDVHRLSRPQLFELRKRMGMMFQNGALLTDLSSADNVAYPLREHSGLPDRMIRDIVLMKLEAVGLRGACDIFPEHLSGGMARRVALARAIAFDPTMVMYDEPFTGQDPISMGVLMRLIRTLNDALGLSSIVVSHSVDEVMSISDYVYIVSAARIVDQGTPAQIRASGLDWTQQFLRGAPDGPVPFHYKAPDYAQDLLENAA
ncbi:MAG TPA: ABC transporter ATP-binding protein [Solimonas sp.]|nr:ABC transporter ATP-binding protein [Solimonas sp.]